MAYTTTYRELLSHLEGMTDKELDEEITVERASAPDETYFAAIETAGSKHPSLKEGHLIIYVEDTDE